MQSGSIQKDVVNDEPVGDAWASAATLWLAERSLWAIVRDEHDATRRIAEELEALGDSVPSPNITFIQHAAGTRRGWTWQVVELAVAPDEQNSLHEAGALRITISVAMAHWWVRGRGTADNLRLGEDGVATAMTTEERTGLLARITTYLLACRAARLAGDASYPARSESELSAGEIQRVDA